MKQRNSINIKTKFNIEFSLWNGVVRSLGDKENTIIPNKVQKETEDDKNINYLLYFKNVILPMELKNNEIMYIDTDFTIKTEKQTIRDLLFADVENIGVDILEIFDLKINEIKKNNIKITEEDLEVENLKEKLKKIILKCYQVEVSFTC